MVSTYWSCLGLKRMREQNVQMTDEKCVKFDIERHSSKFKVSDKENACDRASVVAKQVDVVKEKP